MVDVEQRKRLARYGRTGYIVRMDYNQGAAALKAWMAANGNKTQAEVGALVGVHQTKVSDWLLGRRISLANAITVRDALGVPVDAWTLAPIGEHATRRRKAAS